MKRLKIDPKVLASAKKQHKPSVYRSPLERRIRKEVRALIEAYNHKDISEETLARELYHRVDDEIRRAMCGARIVFVSGEDQAAM